MGSNNKRCVCLPGQIARYKQKISGPLLDRIDIHLEVPPVEIEKLTGQKEPESSQTIRKRVEKARKTQQTRFQKRGILTNSEMNNTLIKEYCQLNGEALELLKMAVSRMNLSARSYHRVLKLARTVADLADSQQILIEHIAESLTYRPRDEN